MQVGQLAQQVGLVQSVPVEDGQAAGGVGDRVGRRGRDPAAPSGGASRSSRAVGPVAVAAVAGRGGAPWRSRVWISAGTSSACSGLMPLTTMGSPASLSIVSTAPVNLRCTDDVGDVAVRAAPGGRGRCGRAARPGRRTRAGGRPRWSTSAPSGDGSHLDQRVPRRRRRIGGRCRRRRERRGSDRGRSGRSGGVTVGHRAASSGDGAGRVGGSAGTTGGADRSRVAGSGGGAGVWRPRTLPCVALPCVARPGPSRPALRAGAPPAPARSGPARIRAAARARLAARNRAGAWVTASARDASLRRRIWSAASSDGLGSPAGRLGSRCAAHAAPVRRPRRRPAPASGPCGRGVRLGGGRCGSRRLGGVRARRRPDSAFVGSAVGPSRRGRVPLAVGGQPPAGVRAVLVALAGRVPLAVGGQPPSGRGRLVGLLRRVPLAVGGLPPTRALGHVAQPTRTPRFGAAPGSVGPGSEARAGGSSSPPD